jgi:hypothetical protein
MGRLFPIPTFPEDNPTALVVLFRLRDILVPMVVVHHPLDLLHRHRVCG